MSEKDPGFNKLTKQELQDKADALEKEIEKDSANLGPLETKILEALEEDKISKKSSSKKSDTKKHNTKRGGNTPKSEEKNDKIENPTRKEANDFLDKIVEGTPLYFNQTKETRIVKTITENKSGVKTYNLDDGSSHTDKALFYARTVGKVGIGNIETEKNKTNTKSEILDIGGGIKITAGQEYADSDRPSVKYEIVKVENGKVFYKMSGSRAVSSMTEEKTRKFFESNPNMKLVGQTWEVSKSKKEKDPKPDTQTQEAPIGGVSMTKEGADARVASLAIGDILYGVSADEYAEITNIETKGKGNKKKKIYTLEKRANGEVMTYSAAELAERFLLGKVAIDSSSEDIGKIEKPEYNIGAIKNAVNDLDIGAVVKGKDSGEEYTLIRLITDKNGNKIFEFENNKTGDKRSESEREMVNSLKNDAFEILSTSGVQEFKEQKPEDVLAEEQNEPAEENAKETKTKEPKIQKEEKGVSPSEDLATARDAYMASYRAMLAERQSVMKGKRNIFGKIWSKVVGEKTSKEDLPEDNAKLAAYEQAKKDYENAKVGYGNYLYAKKKEDLDKTKISEENKVKALADAARENGLDF